MSKVHTKVMTVTSKNTNHKPLFKKKEARTELFFLLPTKKAEVLAKKEKAGAQKCVIHRVR